MHLLPNAKVQSKNQAKKINKKEDRWQGGSRNLKITNPKQEDEPDIYNGIQIVKSLIKVQDIALCHKAHRKAV